jgi:hypothetical protein
VEPEGRRPLGKPTLGGQDSDEIDLQEILCNAMYWINLAQERVQWWSIVNKIM